ncbi:MAG TPA: AAA family ATPase, partial [Polyangiaceae bacterium]
LSYRGLAVGLEPKVSGFLALLLERAGSLISREALRAALWPDGSGSDDMLNYVVSRARQALAHCNRPAIVMNRGRGYRFDIVPTRGERDDDCSSLLDRRDELRELGRLLAHSATTRTCRLAFVTGSGGVGKTAVLEQLSRSAAASGHRVAWGRCLDAVDRPLWAWHLLLEELDRGQVLSCADPFASFAAVTRELARLGREGPLLVVIDDLHWADDATLALLEFVHTRLVDTPVLLAVTCRTPIPKERTARLDGVARRARVISLSPLSSAGAKRLLYRTLRQPLDALHELELLALADGNPSLLLGLARGVAAPARKLDLPALFQSPSYVSNAVQSRLIAFRAETQAVLDAAAVVGVDFDARLLGRVLDIGPRSVADRLAQAVKLDVVRPRTETAYRFAQRLCREYLYWNLEDSERRLLHWKVGTAMSRLEYRELPEGPALMALHLSEGAVSDVQASEAAELVRSAGDSSLRSGDADSAAAAFGHALQLSRRGGWSSTKRVEMALVAASELRHAGAAQHAVQLAERAVEIARAHEDWVSIGRAADMLLRVQPKPS